MKKLFPAIFGAVLFGSAVGQSADQSVRTFETIVSSEIEHANVRIPGYQAIAYDPKNIAFQLLSAPPPNDNCASATSLVVGAACVTGTTREATVQAGEVFDCNSAYPIDQSVWYRFTATSANMYVTVNLTATSGCYLGSAIYSGSCIPTTAVACEDIAGGPLMNIHSMTTLVVGNTYFIQVVYSTTTAGCGGGSPSSRGADFCIAVNNSVNCNTCSNPCGPVCGFAAVPTVAQVTSTCPQYVLHPPLNAGQSGTYCYTFIASNSTVSLGMIANTSGCTSGTVFGVTWTLQTSACGAVLQSGTLANTTMTGLSIGQTYTYCYTPTSACLRLSQYPYMVGASPLPVQLVGFEGEVNQNQIDLAWTTVSETNNDYFTIENSVDGFNFESLGIVKGSGTSSQLNNYRFVDKHPRQGVNYYRLLQTDFDGTIHTSGTVAVKFVADKKLAIHPNPIVDGLLINFYNTDKSAVEIQIYNVSGQLVHSQKLVAEAGTQNIAIDTHGMPSGVYMVRVTTPFENFSSRIVKR